jgi:glycosyltransferase involved in cell wall biosynthesis
MLSASNYLDWIQMPRFSLIVGTKNSTDDLLPLLSSLRSQQAESFEVFIVDQNPDDRLLPILSQFTDLPIHHMRATPGLARARNLAFPFCKGEIIAFPDDDCWYPPDLMHNVSNWLDSHPEEGLLTITMRDVSGKTSANHWKSNLCDLAPINVFRTTASSTIFVRRDVCALVRFDEVLGVGSSTVFGSGEDTDFVLSLLARGIRGKYTQCLHVFHPMTPIPRGEGSKERALYYGRGTGYVLRKHKLAGIGILLVLFDVTRAGLCSVTGRAARGIFCWYHGAGIIKGYLAN